jgi:hypothetical protein
MKKEQLAVYADSFIKRAQENGLSEGQAVDLLKSATQYVELSKQAEGMPMDAAQAAPEAAGAAPQGGNEQQEMAMIMQLLQQHPEMLQAIMQQLQGGAAPQGAPAQA